MHLGAAKEERLVSLLLKICQKSFSTLCDDARAFINCPFSDAAFLERGVCRKSGVTRVFGAKIQVFNRPRWRIRFPVNARCVRVIVNTPIHLLI